jgi:hypothetical protein
MIALLLALACAPKPQALPAGFDPKAGPLLPAMEAPIYASGRSVPTDVLVSQVALGLKWDEALSGAAAAMALLDGQPLTLEAAQHAAYRAGYPYPVQRMSMGWMEAGVYPDELGRSLAATLKDGDEIGLARARTAERDRWVALIARPVDALSPISRELRLGAEVPIRTRTPCTWTLVSPRGQVQTGMTPAMVALEEAGEWWLEVRTLNATVASIPLYVDMATPKGPLLDLPGDSVTGPGDGMALTLELLADVRDSFGLVGLQRDGVLDTLSATPLAQVLDKVWTHEDGMARLRAAGFVGGPAHQVHCTAGSVAACLDTMLRDPQRRKALLDPGLRLVGGSAQVGTSGVTLLLNMASE